MWPLRPHFVRSSTGLNHMMSSGKQRERAAKIKHGRPGKAETQGEQFKGETFPLTSVEEHVPNDGRAAVNFEGVSTEDNPLQHDTPRIATEQAACGHKVLDALSDETTQSL